MRIFLRVTAAGVAISTLCATSALAFQDGDLDAAPQLRLIEEARIGYTADSNGATIRIGDVALDQDGQVYVVESRDYGRLPFAALAVHVYSPAGRPVRTIGQLGEGPGQFWIPPHMGVIGDTVWTITGGENTIALFSRAGPLLSTANAQPVSFMRPGRQLNLVAVAMRSDGTILSDLTSLPPPTPGRRDTIFYPRVIWRAQGRIVDTVGYDRFVAPTAEGTHLSAPALARGWDDPIHPPTNRGPACLDQLPRWAVHARAPAADVPCRKHPRVARLGERRHTVQSRVPLPPGCLFRGGARHARGTRGSTSE